MHAFCVLNPHKPGIITFFVGGGGGGGCYLLALASSYREKLCPQSAQTVACWPGLYMQDLRQTFSLQGPLGWYNIYILL